MTATGLTDIVTCEAVSVTLGRRRVVDDVDLHLRSGEWLGLIGPNGAGKSSLLRAMAGLVDHEGRITMADGRRPGPLDLALVPQHPVMPSGMSVAEYVLLGRTAHLGWLARESDHDRQVVADVLRRLDLQPFAARAVGALSGGETQRVIIARALAQQTPVLLLDEPTSALDIGHQTGVLELVDELRRHDGITVLAVMHDLTTAARFSDRLVLLDAGRIVTTGRASDVLDPALLSRTYATSLSVRDIDGDLVVLPGRRPRP